jgi:hypothetical protein
MHPNFKFVFLGLNNWKLHNTYYLATLKKRDKVIQGSEIIVVTIN